jgi:8-oxo-dGTP diphosphatase
MVTCEFENGNKNNLRHVTAGCLVLRGDSILLGKRGQGLLEAGKWGLFGGYVELHETVEEAAVRETMEESGWEIRNLRLLRINDNPHRPHEDRQNIEFIFMAEAVALMGEKDWETEEVRWYSLDRLPAHREMAFDHLDSIHLYQRYEQSPFDLPVIGKL